MMTVSSFEVDFALTRMNFALLSMNLPELQDRK